MDPNSGRLYTPAQAAELTEAERAELVEIIGTREQVERVSRAVARSHRFDDDDATYRDGFADGMKAARDATENFHRGSCRWYYTERRCTCGLHDAIDGVKP